FPEDVDVRGLAYSPDGGRLAVGSSVLSARGPGAILRSKVRILDARTSQQQLAWQAHEARIRGLAFSPDGRRLASAGWDKTVRVWDPTTGEQLRLLSDPEGGFDAVAYSPDGRLLAAAAGSRKRSGTDLKLTGVVHVWDAETGQEVRAFPTQADSQGALS